MTIFSESSTTLSHRLTASILLTLPLLLLLTACGNDTAEPGKQHVKHSPFANPHAGKVLALACQQCHGQDGVSNIIGVPHLAGQNETYLRDALLAYHKGKRQHDVMQEVAKTLTEKQMLDLAAWYSDQTVAKNKTPITNTPTATNSAEAEGIVQGRKLSQACADCHGLKGNSTVPGIPNLTGQHPDYLINAMESCRIRNDRNLQDLSKTMSRENLSDIALFYAIQEPEQSPTRSLGDAEASVERAKKCTFCHGKNGNSKKDNVPSLAGQDPAYLATAIRAYASGQKDHVIMSKAVKDLEEDEIDNLAAWFTHQKPEKARHVLIPRSAKQWSKKCDSCHGDNGNGLGNAAPRLAGQRVEYLHSSILAYKQHTRDAGNMHGMTTILSKREIDDLASYYSQK